MLPYSCFIDIPKDNIRRLSSQAVKCIGPRALAVRVIGPLNDCALIQKQLFLTLCNLLGVLCVLDGDMTAVYECARKQLFVIY